MNASTLHTPFVLLYSRGVVAQWIRPRTLSREVPGSDFMAAAAVPLGKAPYLNYLVPRKGLKTIGPLVTCLRT